jgi:hypothetical protein
MGCLESEQAAKLPTSEGTPLAKQHLSKSPEFSRRRRDERLLQVCNDDVVLVLQD